MSFLYLIFSPFHYFLSRCFLITFLNVFPFGVTFNFFFLTVFEHCNDPGAQGRSFSYTFGKECDIRNLRVSENRKTRLLQFNGILFKVCLSCSKQDRGYSLLGIKVLLNNQAKAQVIYGWYSTLLLLSSLQNSAKITTSN